MPVCLQRQGVAEPPDGRVRTFTAQAEKRSEVGEIKSPLWEVLLETG